MQWGLAYAAGAWALLQGIDFFADTFHWPELAKQFAAIALIVGLPIVLTLAWYHGDKGQQRITRDEVAILTLLFLLGGGLFWYYQRKAVPDVVLVMVDPALVKLHEDARWLPLLRKLGMAPEQLAAIKFDVKLPE